MHWFFAGLGRRDAGRPSFGEDAAAADGRRVGGRGRAGAGLRARAAALHALRRVPLRRLQVAPRHAQSVIREMDELLSIDPRE